MGAGHRNGGKVRAPATQSRWAVVRQLVERRVAMNVTRDELADRSGYHPMMIGRYERGETTPSLKTLCDLAQALGVEVALIARET